MPILSISAIPWAYLVPATLLAIQSHPPLDNHKWQRFAPTPAPVMARTNAAHPSAFSAEHAAHLYEDGTTGRRHGKASVPIMATPRAVDKLGR